jgi:hypothetical protein
MSAPDVRRVIVDGVGPLEDNRFRWTRKEARFQLVLHDMAGLRLHTRFWLAAGALRQTGPVTVALTLNSHEIARRRFDAEGEQNWDVSLERQWLADGGNLVGLSVDKAFHPEMGIDYGVALVEIGFVD